jgi:hypothetical protein
VVNGSKALGGFGLNLDRRSDAGIPELLELLRVAQEFDDLLPASCVLRLLCYFISSHDTISRIALCSAHADEPRRFTVTEGVTSLAIIPPELFPIHPIRAVKMRTLVAVALLLLTDSSGFASKQVAPVADLLSIYAALDEMCRGWSGDDPHTDQVCSVRQKVDVVLKTMGYCYGRQGQAGAEMRWHKCSKSND